MCTSGTCHANDPGLRVEEQCLSPASPCSGLGFLACTLLRGTILLRQPSSSMCHTHTPRTAAGILLKGGADHSVTGPLETLCGSSSQTGGSADPCSNAPARPPTPTSAPAAPSASLRISRPPGSIQHSPWCCQCSCLCPWPSLYLNTILSFLAERTCPLLAFMSNPPFSAPEDHPKDPV